MWCCSFIISASTGSWFPHSALNMTPTHTQILSSFLPSLLSLRLRFLIGNFNLNMSSVGETAQIFSVRVKYIWNLVDWHIFFSFPGSLLLCLLNLLELPELNGIVAFFLAFIDNSISASLLALRGLFCASNILVIG